MSDTMDAHVDQDPALVTDSGAEESLDSSRNHSLLGDYATLPSIPSPPETPSPTRKAPESSAGVSFSSPSRSPYRPYAHSPHTPQMETQVVFLGDVSEQATLGIARKPKDNHDNAWVGGMSTGMVSPQEQEEPDGVAPDTPTSTLSTNSNNNSPHATPPPNDSQQVHTKSSNETDPETPPHTPEDKNENEDESRMVRAVTWMDPSVEDNETNASVHPKRNQRRRRWYLGAACLSLVVLIIVIPLLVVYVDRDTSKQEDQDSSSLTTRGGGNVTDDGNSSSVNGTLTEIDSSGNNSTNSTIAGRSTVNNNTTVPTNTTTTPTNATISSRPPPVIINFNVTITNATVAPTMAPTRYGGTSAPTPQSHFQAPRNNTSSSGAFIHNGTESGHQSSPPETNVTTVAPGGNNTSDGAFNATTTGGGSLTQGNAEQALELWTLISSITDPSILEDATTPQYMAYQWLLNVNEGSLWTDTTDLQRVQRYVLAVLDYSLHSTTSEPTFVHAILDECTWSGITCNARAEVTQLVWPSAELDGTLVDELGVLTSLTTLDLANNAIAGGIPDSLYDLTKLENVYLHQNQLTGTLSADLIDNWYSVENFYLGNNQLSGPFPVKLGTLRRGPRPLRKLSLHQNQFSGEIPRDLNLENMYYMDLSYNRFSGEIPADWVQDMDSLRHLHLDHNLLEGQVPRGFAEIGDNQLLQLTLNDNLLEGDFPGDNWPDSLVTLELQNNQFASISNSEDLCGLIVWESGKENGLVTFGADCEICECDFFCGPDECY